MTEQIKRKRGRPLGYKGFKHSEESRRKISNTMTEVWKDDDKRRMYVETQKAGRVAAKAIHQ